MDWCFSAVILNAINSLFSRHDKLLTINVETPNTWHVLANPPKLVTLSIKDATTINDELVVHSSLGWDGKYFLWAFWEFSTITMSFDNAIKCKITIFQIKIISLNYNSLKSIIIF